MNFDDIRPKGQRIASEIAPEDRYDVMGFMTAVSAAFSPSLQAAFYRPGVTANATPNWHEGSLEDFLAAKEEKPPA